MTATCTCPHCGRQIEFEVENVGAVAACPQCGRNVNLSINATLAKIKSKTEYAGVGAAVQTFGLLTMLLGIPAGSVGVVFGVIIGLLFIIIGGRMAIKCYCGNCGNSVENKEVKMCPVCHSTLAK